MRDYAVYRNSWLTCSFLFSLYTELLFLIPFLFREALTSHSLHRIVASLILFGFYSTFLHVELGRDPCDLIQFPVMQLWEFRYLRNDQKLSMRNSPFLQNSSRRDCEWHFFFCSANERQIKGHSSRMPWILLDPWATPREHRPSTRHFSHFQFYFSLLITSQAFPLDLTPRYLIRNLSLNANDYHSGQRARCWKS